MSHYKKSIFIGVFLLLFFNCEEKKEKSSFNQNVQEKELVIHDLRSNAIQMDSLILINGEWVINSIKHNINGVLQGKQYYNKFSGVKIEFEHDGILKLNDESIGKWNDRYININNVDSLKGEYYFTKMNNLVQIVKIGNNLLNEYFYINIQQRQKESPDKVVDNEKINFDQ